jgi:hypothetical protein
MTHANLTAIDAALAATDTPVIASFLSHLRHIHPDDRLPARAAFDPMAVPQLLPNLVLAEVRREDGAIRFFIRVAGETVLGAAPVPLMNRYLESSVRLTENPGDESKERIVDVRRQVVDSGRTIHWRGRVNIPFRFNFGEVEFVHAPLAEDGVTVDRILSALFYHGAPENP